MLGSKTRLRDSEGPLNQTFLRTQPTFHHLHDQNLGYRFLRGLPPSSPTGSGPRCTHQRLCVCYCNMVPVASCSAPLRGSPLLRPEDEVQVTDHDSRAPPPTPASLPGLLSWCTVPSALGPSSWSSPMGSPLPLRYALRLPTSAKFSGDPTPSLGLFLCILQDLA